MQTHSPRWPAFALLLLALPALAAPSKHAYRYSLSTRSGDPRFAVELDHPANARGEYFSVETDDRGRISRVQTIRDGKAVSEARYHFPGDSALADEVVNFNNGERTGVTKIQRNAKGERTREDNLTSTGALTEYTIYEPDADPVQETTFTAAGAKKWRRLSYYSPAGLAVRRRYFPPNGNVSLDYEMDGPTGQVISFSQYEGDTKVSRTVPSYDSNGDQIRTDSYGPDGQWYRADEFTNGLRTRRLQKMGPNWEKELRFEYDDKRWMKEARLSINGKLLCTFSYDRMPDGTPRRTLAKGPDGSLWAEYPDIQVIDVDQEGHPAGRGATGIIHHKGNWY